MSQVIHCANSQSPSKGGKKTEQKVQFAELENVKEIKLISKPPEIPRHTAARANGGRLHSSSSLSSLNNGGCSNVGRKPSIGRGTNSLERSLRRSESANRSSPNHCKRPGSVNRNKSNELPLAVSELKRSQSLDKRTPSRCWENDNKQKKMNDVKDIYSGDKKIKPRHSNERNVSEDRIKSFSPFKTYFGHPILTQNGVNKSPGQSSNAQHNKESSNFDFSQTLRRTLSRSPKRYFNKENDGGDKENNEKSKARRHRETTSNDYQDRGRSTQKREITAEEKVARAKRLESYWKMEDEVMWLFSHSGVKRAGYLLFKCSSLDDPIKNSIAGKYAMTFKFSQADSKLIRLLMQSHGFKEVPTSSSSFNLYWGNAHFGPNEIRQLQEWQKINHFPRSSELTRKDRLYLNIKRMQRQYGVKLFDFIPTSFVLPTEYREFADTHLRERGTWIVKPVASSQGKGIYLVSQVDQVPADETSLVCRYLDSPLLVDGYKCDLRLYVVVTSLDPMVVYLYEEGLVRLATIKYQNGKNLWNPCIHLTNYSVNKFHSNYVQNEDPEIDDRGNKWSLSAFLRHLKARGIDTGALMRGIEDVIIKSLLSASYQMNTATNMFVPHPRNCFEMYGFDILIDDQLKPWILEVNLSPSLNIDQPLDLKIKSSMLADLFSLIGIPICNPSTIKPSSRPSVFRKLPNLRHSTESYERSHFGRPNSNSNLIPTTEELRIFRQIKEEYERRGGWARIYPTPDSWAMYGSFQEYDSPLNFILHNHLYPNIPRNSRYYRVAPLKMSSVSSSGLASSLERLSCYERALPKGLTVLKTKGAKKKPDVKTGNDLQHVKSSLVNALENGLALSKYQARMAFSVYLQHVQRRLMIGCDQEKQTDLVFRFLRSATRTLQLPVNVQAPSKTLPHEARAVVISKQLGDFIQAYTKETHLYLDQHSSSSCSSLSSQCPTSSVPTPSEPQSPLSNQNAIPESDNQQFIPSEGDFSPNTTKESSLTASSLISVNSLTDASSASSLRGSSASLAGFSPSSATDKRSSIDTAFMSTSSIPSMNEASKKRVGFFQNQLRRFKSDGDSGISSATDDDSNRSIANDNEESAVSPKEICPRKQSNADDGIAMELYRTFLSNARESDLEEVLSLQTKMHNSVGVFLDPTRRSRSSYSASSSNVTTPSSRPRTPNVSPQGSPRRARRSPVYGDRGSQTHLDEPVTNEPHSTDPKRLSSATSAPGIMSSAAATSACCLFGNILKASLKGTNTTFNS